MQVVGLPVERPNATTLATDAAREAESTDPPAPGDTRIVVAFFGLKGAGKTATIKKLLGEEEVDAFDGGTKRVKVYDGQVKGVKVRFIDSPGLDIGADADTNNRKTLLGARPQC